MDAATKARLIRAMADTVIAHTEELTGLDQAIGDGDHGINMRRGAEAVLAELPSLAEKPWPELLKAVGMALVMKIGGASGPLYGTLALELGKAMPAEPSRADAVAAFAAAIAGVQARGKSVLGQKTLLDVLGPAQAALADGADGVRLRSVVDQAAAATVPMLAGRGRAAFLAERSIGHMDPGARSAALLLTALADELGARP